MKKIIFIISLALLSCTNEKNARIYLQADGYTDIRFTGYSFCCDEGDTYATGFIANNWRFDRRTQKATGNAKINRIYLTVYVYN